MLNAFRRGPASVAANPIACLARIACPTSIRLPDAGLYTTRVAGYTSTRTFQSSLRWRRAAAVNTALENEAVEAEVDQEIEAQRPPSDPQIDEAIRHGPVTRFKELADRNMVCQTVVDTITENMGLETMTQVQSMTINETLKGIDVLAQARTGTGKTLAFLIPVLQNIIGVDPRLEKRSSIKPSSSSADIRAIVVSPTRELAEQIAVEARKVTRNTGVIVQTAVGGSQKALGLRTMKAQGCHILVGTPGRLNDILSDPYSQVRAPNLSALVLDEADRLLDQGFAPEIASIQRALPNRRDVDRQTLLFSATVPREVMSVVRQTMKPDFKFVRTVQAGEQQTHERVVQRLVNVRGFENLIPALVELCQREILQSSPSKPFKAIVYFSVTADVSLTSQALRNLKDLGARTSQEYTLHPAKVIAIHGKLDQGQRTRAAEAFRNADSAILLSSDVTARGMDFPGVTHVIQVGMPPTEEQYVHRVGRTARGNNTGEGWLLLSDLEMQEVRSKLRGMPLQMDETLETAKVDMTRDAQLPEQTAKILTQTGEAMNMVPRSLKVGAYMASLGFTKGHDKQQIIDALNDRAKYGWGMMEPPKVNHSLALKLGFNRCRGLILGHEPSSSDEGYRGNAGNSSFSRGRFGSDRTRGGGFGRTDRGGYGRSSFEGDRGFRGEFDRSRTDRGDRSGFSRKEQRGGYGGRDGYRGNGSRSFER